MTTKQPIHPADIQPGDLVRWEESGSEYAQEFRRGGTGTLAGRGAYFLLDRPRKIIHEAGKVLWLTVDYVLFKKGDAVVVAGNHHEDDYWIRVRSGTGVVCIAPDEITDVKPETYRKIAQSEIDKLQAAKDEGFRAPAYGAAWQALATPARQFLEHAAAAPRV